MLLSVIVHMEGKSMIAGELLLRNLNLQTQYAYQRCFLLNGHKLVGNAPKWQDFHIPPTRSFSNQHREITQGA